MDLEVRRITPEEVPTFLRTTWAAFGYEPTDELREAWSEAVEADRAYAAFDGDRLVASACAFSLELTVPGRTRVAAGGLSMVGVLPTHRRLGSLRALMQRHLDDVRSRSEPIALLTASEAAIYGRFGYGPGTWVARRDIATPHARFSAPAPPRGTISLVDRDTAVAALPAVHDRIRAGRVGEVSRTSGLWSGTWAERDAEAGRQSRWFHALHRNHHGEVDGYALYRVADETWNGGISRQKVRARFDAATDDAHLALWRYLLELDLVEEVRVWTRPDDPVRWRLADPRRLRTTAVSDHLWVRVMDVSQALSARRYEHARRLVVEVTDAFRPELAGRYALEGGPDGATCEPTDSPADLTMDAATLASIYLGGVPVDELLRAGRVEEHRTGAATAAGEMFTTRTPPYCGTEF